MKRSRMPRNDWARGDEPEWMKKEKASVEKAMKKIK